MDIIDEEQVPASVRFMPICSFIEHFGAVRLIKAEGCSCTACSYEIWVKVIYQEPMKLSLWEHLKLRLQRKPWPMATVTTWKPLRCFLDDDPSDPYMENCAREVFDYLTKDYELDV